MEEEEERNFRVGQILIIISLPTIRELMLTFTTMAFCVMGSIKKRSCMSGVPDQRGLLKKRGTYASSRGFQIFILCYIFFEALCLESDNTGTVKNSSRSYSIHAIRK